MCSTRNWSAAEFSVVLAEFLEWHHVTVNILSHLLELNFHTSGKCGPMQVGFQAGGQGVVAELSLKPDSFKGSNRLFCLRI